MAFVHNSNYSETLIDTYLFTFLNSINHQVNNSYLSLYSKHSLTNVANSFKKDNSKYSKMPSLLVGAYCLRIEQINRAFN